MSATELTWDDRIKSMNEKKADMEKNNPLYKAIEAFYAKQDKYRKLGATDTEPRCVFKGLLRKHLRGEEVVFIPPVQKSEGNCLPDIEEDMWQLYSSESGWKRANKALSTACKKVLKAADKATMKQVRECDEWYGELLNY